MNFYHAHPIYGLVKLDSFHRTPGGVVGKYMETSMVSVVYAVLREDELAFGGLLIYSAIASEEFLEMVSSYLWW